MSSPSSSSLQKATEACGTRNPASASFEMRRRLEGVRKACELRSTTRPEAVIQVPHYDKKDGRDLGTSERILLADPKVPVTDCKAEESPCSFARLENVGQLMQTEIVANYELNKAKANLSKLVAAAEGGEEVILTRHGTPVARLSGIQNRQERVLGFHPIAFQSDLLEPMDTAVVDEFYQSFSRRASCVE